VASAAGDQLLHHAAQGRTGEAQGNSTLDMNIKLTMLQRSVLGVGNVFSSQCDLHAVVQCATGVRCITRGVALDARIFTAP